MGGKETLRLLLKGNHDLTDSIIGQVGAPQGAVPFISGLGREKYAGAFKIEVEHEPGGRSDLWLQQLEMKGIPPEFLEQGLSGPFVAAQFKTVMLTDKPDVVVLSVQPDAVQTLYRHRSDRYLFQVLDDWAATWPAARRQWFLSQFEPVGLLPADQSKENLTRLIRAIKERVDAHVIIYNCSTVDPADDVHDYFRHSDESLARRIHQLDLALMQISVQEGISIMDVDRRVAELGAGRHVPVALRYTPEASQAIGKEFFTVLGEIGFFEKRPLVVQVGRKTGAA
jgi:hypothetical protein